MDIRTPWWLHPTSDTLMLPLGLRDFLAIAKELAGAPVETRVAKFHPSSYDTTDPRVERACDELVAKVDQESVVEMSFEALAFAASASGRANEMDVTLAFEDDRQLIIVAIDSSFWAVGGDSDLGAAVAKEAWKLAAGKLILYRQEGNSLIDGTPERR